jgi:hypothetical protein
MGAQGSVIAVEFEEFVPGDSYHIVERNIQEDIARFDL